MLREFVERHPNHAKNILCSMAFFKARYSLAKQISDLENLVADTDLEKDIDIKRQLGSLKRALNGLTERQDNICKFDEKQCAEYLLDFEDELYPQPITICRYYKGETENPFEEVDSVKASLWFHERCWVNFKQDSQQKNFFCTEIAEYICYNLLDFNDNVPLSLKTLLWNRYCHWNYSDSESFKFWYLNCYLQ